MPAEHLIVVNGLVELDDGTPLDGREEHVYVHAPKIHIIDGDGNFIYIL